MSEIGEIFKALKEHRQEKKQSNKEWSTQFLTKQSIKFQVKNDGIHLIVDSFKGEIDFWPTTGKYIKRKSTHSK